MPDTYTDTPVLAMEKLLKDATHSPHYEHGAPALLPSGADAALRADQLGGMVGVEGSPAIPQHAGVC